MNKRLLLTAVILTAIPSASFAFETAQAVTATPITTVPFVITKPGNYYLPDDLTFTAPAGSAIVVEASQVILDLNGRTLKGTAETFDTTNGIVVDNRKDVIIQNGDIDGFTFAGVLITDNSERTKNQKNEVLHINFNNDEIGVVDVSGSIDVTEHCNFDGGSIGWFDIASLGGDRLQSCNFQNQNANEGMNVGVAILSSPGNGVLVEDCLVSKGSNAFGEILQGATDRDRFNSFVGGSLRFGGTVLGAGSD